MGQSLAGRAAVGCAALRVPSCGDCKWGETHQMRTAGAG